LLAWLDLLDLLRFPVKTRIRPRDPDLEEESEDPLLSMGDPTLVGVVAPLDGVETSLLESFSEELEEFFRPRLNLHFPKTMMDEPFCEI
jgi:hypothetical protein